jgi:formate hydrogenlyase subunit 4
MRNAILLLILAPIIGGLLSGLDRRITASLQGRVGPPLLQPFYDVMKLWGKEPIAVNRLQLLYAYVFVAFSALTTVLLALRQDLLMILFVLTVASLALILGGLSVQSPYSRIGGYREILEVLAYEPVLVLMVAGIYLATGSFGVGSVFKQTGPLLFRLPLLFLAFLTILPIKLRKSPFDLSSSHHAHQEIVRGVTTEYSGPYLALIEI